MVRDNLGEDAIIVATREENGGRSVRVTAAVEPGFELGKNGSAAPAESWLQYDDEEEEGGIAEELTEVMLRHSVPEDVMDHIISCATVMGLDDPGAALVAALEHLFTFQPLPLKPYNKALMMVGPPGSGKTLAVAKLAARSTMSGLNVGVISTDTVRAGGIEQLESFTRLMNIDLKKAENTEDLMAALNNMEGMDQVIIDTQGINPFDTDDIKHLAKLIGARDIEPVLTLPAAGDCEESGEIARIFATIGVGSLIPTRIDIARRLGGLLAAAHRGGLHFADAGNTPKVADGLVPLSPKALAKMLMPGAYRQQKPQTIRRTGT